MKSFVIGLAVGVVLTVVVGLFLWPTSVSVAVPETESVSHISSPLKKTVPSPQPIANTKAQELPAQKSDGDFADLLAREIMAVEKELEESGMDTDTASAIDSLAQHYEARNRGRGNEYREKVDALKKKGAEIIPDLLKILNGTASDTSKVIAAGVLGAINADLQDPEITQMLVSKIVPMLQNIATSQVDPSTKRQAIQSLGEIKDDASAKALAEIMASADRHSQHSVIDALGSVGTQTAQETLADITVGNEGQWTRMQAVRTLGQTGTVEAAYRLLPVLSETEDRSRMMAAASSIAQINSKANDPAIDSQLDSVVPVLQEVVTDENESRQNKWMAMSTLGNIGSDEANDLLIEYAAGGKDIDQAVTHAALWASALNGTPELAVGLEEVLQNTPEESGKIGVAGAIVSIANRNEDSASAAAAKTQAMPVLYDIASTGSTTEIQRNAIESIGRYGSSDDIDSLNQLGEANDELKSSAQQAVERIQRRESGDNAGFGGRWR